MSGVNTVARALGSPHMLAWLSTVEPLRGFLGSLTVFSVLHVLLARLMLRWEWRAAPGYGTSARKPAFGWQLACRVVAMVHAVCVTSLGAACFRGAGRLSTIEWTAAHGAAETAVSAFSAGFFLQDWAYIVVKEWDITFFLHHTAVLCFLAASHISGAAGRVCAVGLSMGEATNVLQNTLWITRALSNPERPRQFALAVALKKKLVLPLFALAYAVVRLGISPTVSFWIVRECLSGSGALHKLYAFLGTGLQAGSFLWAASLVRYVHRTYRCAPRVVTVPDLDASVADDAGSPLAG